MKKEFRYNGKDSSKQLANTIKEVAGDKPVFFCIGTDKCLCDSLGPKIGTRIKERSNGSIIVYGVEGDTINALNVQKAYGAVRYAHPKSKIIAIDAAIGNDTGTIRINGGGIRPGSGVGKDLGVVGDESIICTLGKSIPKTCKVLQLFIGLMENLNVLDSRYYEKLARYKRIEEFVDTAADTIADAILLAAA